MMNVRFFISALFVGAFLSGQHVALIKVERVSDSKDKIFYHLNEPAPSSTFLGEIEVNGFSNNDVDMFGKVYSKAKEIGGNTFSINKPLGIDGSAREVNPSFYKLSVFDTPSADIPKDGNTIYIVGDSKKDQKFSVNGSLVKLPARHFLKLLLKPDEKLHISTRKFLGSSVNLQYEEGGVVQYLQLSGSKLFTGGENSPGLNYKSGDIVLLERSYGGFLCSVYTETKH